MSDLFEELKRRHVIRAILAYAAAVFVALQVADLTFEPLGLGPFAYRFVVILSIVGFPVVAVSAWIFDLRNGRLQRTPEREGETARRTSPLVGLAVVGGTVAVAGAAAWVAGGGGDASPVMLDDQLIAVAPFRVSASDASLGYLREGAVDLLAAKLTDAPRVVDPRTMLTAWRDRAGTVDADLSEDQIVDLAAGLGAGRVLFGSIVGGGDDLTLTASLRDVAADDVIAETMLRGSPASMTSMIDGLAARLLGAQAGASVESVTSSSIDAVRAYLDGRAAYRRGAFTEAFERFSRAVELDSTFAAAALAAVDANSMRIYPVDDGHLRTLASEHRGRLSSDDQLYLRAVLGVNYPAVSTEREQIEFQREVTERLPLRAEAWYELGDQLFHWGHLAGFPDELTRAEAAFRRALDLDPGFTNARLHLVWTLTLARDSSALREARFLPPPHDLKALVESGQTLAIDDPEVIQRLPAVLDSLFDDLSWSALIAMPQYTGPLSVDLGPYAFHDVTERATLRAIEISPNPELRQVARELRYEWLANLERWDEAVALIEEMALAGARAESDQKVLELTTLWGAPLSDDVVAAPFERTLAWWDSMGRDAVRESEAAVERACVLALHAHDEARDDLPRDVTAAIRPTGGPEAVGDDLIRSARFTCATLLDARVANSTDATALTRLGEWLDRGPAGARMRLIGNLEAARMWQARNDADRTWVHGRRSARSPIAYQFLRNFTELQAWSVEAGADIEGPLPPPDETAGFDWRPAGTTPGG